MFSEFEYCHIHNDWARADQNICIKVWLELKKNGWLKRLLKVIEAQIQLWYWCFKNGPQFIESHVWSGRPWISAGSNLWILTDGSKIRRWSGEFKSDDFENFDKWSQHEKCNGQICYAPSDVRVGGIWCSSCWGLFKTNYLHFLEQVIIGNYSKSGLFKVFKKIDIGISVWSKETKALFTVIKSSDKVSIS